MGALFSHKPGGERRSLYSFGTNINSTISTAHLRLRAHAVVITASQAYIVHRSGSIIGVSAFLDVNAVTVSGNVLLVALIGNPGTDAVTTATQNIAGAGNVTFRATAPVGLHPFVAGDLISCAFLGDGATDIETDNYLGAVEVEWDD